MRASYNEESLFHRETSPGAGNCIQVDMKMKDFEVLSTERLHLLYPYSPGGIDLQPT